MQVVVIGTTGAQKEFQEKGIAEGVEVHFENSVVHAKKEADAYFYLLPEEGLPDDLEALKSFNRPTFVNAVTTTLNDLGEKFVRINGWPTFIERSSLEIAASESTLEEAARILKSLGWKFYPVPDIAGLISARVIAMIVNEAYFALGDEVSTKEDIDIAMKLGTNYPFGPFEWSEKIGLKNIATLLKHLSASDKRYTPAPELLKEMI